MFSGLSLWTQIQQWTANPTDLAIESNKLKMNTHQKPENIRINIEPFGLTGYANRLGEFVLNDVYDLVDIIQHVESTYSFLRKVKYQVAVNGFSTERNQQIYSGDHIIIRPVLDQLKWQNELWIP